MASMLRMSLGIVKEVVSKTELFHKLIIAPKEDMSQDCVGVDTLNYTVTIIVTLAVQQAGRPNLIRSPKGVRLNLLA